MKIHWPTRRSLTALSGVALSASLVASACSSQSANSENTTLPDFATDAETVLLSSSLEIVNSCDRLLERIQNDSLERVGPYGLDQPQHSSFAPDLIDEGAFTEPDSETEVPQTEQRLSESDEESSADSAADSAAGTSADGSQKDTSGTNNQEEGVEEADVVKSDGSTLAIVSGGELRVLDVTGDTPKLTQTISVAHLGEPTGMFLNGDRLILLSIDYGRGGQPTSLITDIDLRDGSVDGSAEFDGQYVSSREIDGSLRVVLSSAPAGIDFVYPDGRTDETQAEQENRERIEDSQVEDWLPSYRITGDGGRQASQPLVDCDRVHLPQNFSGGGQVVVATIDVDDPLKVVDAVAVHTDVQTVYASTNRLIIAAPEWPALSDPSRSDSVARPFRTALHSFAIDDTTSTDYVASGSVQGLLLNQFSLSEHEGNLRVATTDTSQRRFVNGGVWEPDSESYVTVLSEEAGALVAKGQVGGLGRGEEIFAVRFIGDVGYVVTFRQIDPLYTVDLSDPSNPRLLGELKIPGFSNYLHEIDDRTLMGVGSDGNDEGQILGTAVSLFDVEDLSDPTRLDKYTFDDNTSTPVAYDAKAFTYSPSTNTVIVPVQSDYLGSRLVENGESIESRVESEAAVFDVDTAVGRIELRGTINHNNRCAEPTSGTSNRRVPRNEDVSGSSTPDPTPLPNDASEFYEPDCDSTISRTMVIGNDIYTFSFAGLSVHNLDDLSEKVWISFS